MRLCDSWICRRLRVVCGCVESCLWVCCSIGFLVCIRASVCFPAFHRQRRHRRFSMPWYTLARVPTHNNISSIVLTALVTTPFLLEASVALGTAWWWDDPFALLCSLFRPFFFHSLLIHVCRCLCPAPSPRAPESLLTGILGSTT